MARPITLPDRASINVYLHAQQKDRLTQEARRAGMSPSALIRQLLDREFQFEA